MRTLIATAASALVIGVGAAAFQPRPDFSGEWRVETGVPPPAAPVTSPPAMPGDMGSGWGPALAIRQDAAALIIEDRRFSRYDLQPAVRLVYPLDGSEATNTVMIGHTAQRPASRAIWQAETLEIVTRYSGAHPAGESFTSEVVQRLRLDSPDRLVVEVTRRTDGLPATSTRAIYRKQAPQP